MIHVIFAIFAILIRIHANPLPQSSNELISARQYSAEATSDIASLGPSSDLGITGNAEGPPPEDRVIAGNTLDEANTNLPSLGCTSDSSTDVLDENTVLRRSSTVCPVNIMAPTRPILPGPVQKEPNLLRQEPPVDIHRKSKPRGDARCADHTGRPNHVKCGGPEIGVRDDVIGMVANCERAALVTDVIPTRPPKYVFDPKYIFAEYCCETFGEDNIVFMAAMCTKLTQTRIPRWSKEEFQAWLQQWNEDN